ncbi:hypothetical protein M413DRAFT_200248 [Hebeloma cylindrosporum]|uniref:DH domain-containing protein n=1 Tax=Hebeloma cylindrosporum TaxID=76867 RepID=A0A0C3CU80_HEBCY|nr:hypothetical protein M413DRAFT_200248 [Hebeloma cylindrosporum h7]
MMMVVVAENVNRMLTYSGGTEDAQTSTSNTPTSPFVLISRKSQTYIHKRTASLGDAAVSLLLGVEQRKENGKDRNDELNDDDDDPEGFEKWIENDSKNAFQSNQHTSPIKRARFVILGSESDVDLPSYANSGRSSPLPLRSERPLPPLPASSSLTSSPIPSPTHLPASSETIQPQTQERPLPHPPSSFVASTSTSSIQRPPLLRRDAQSADSHEPVRRRRWTLASAMTDEAISDEGLVKELEKMRELGVWNRQLLSKEGKRASGGGGGDSMLPLDEADSIWDVGREIWEGTVDREKGKGKMDDEGDGVLNPSSSSSYLLGTASWLTAQRALLICRELIMTERHYHALLLSLLAGDTHTPPPSLMQHYAAELVRASAAVLRAMEQQPSALGIAKAFVENAEELEGAYVRWCGVVGGWFVSSVGAGGEDNGNVNVKLKRNRSRYRASVDSADPPGYGGVESEDGHSASSNSPPPVSPLKRTARAWRRSLPSVASLGEAGASIYGYGYGYGSKSLRRRNKDKDKEREGAEEVRSGVVDLSSTTMTTSSSSSSSAQNLTSRPPPPTRVRSKPGVRDLAILPTQRVMRYVLLYRDLLSHTPPTSSSRVFVEQAVEAACRIADRCDRAQGNAAFIVSSAGAAGGASGGGGGSTSASAQSAAETTISRRSNSARTTTTTSSSGESASTPPSSVEGEEQDEEQEQEQSKPSDGGAGAGGDLGDQGCHVKLSSSMRRMSMNVSFMSSMGWGRG